MRAWRSRSTRSRRRFGDACLNAEAPESISIAVRCTQQAARATATFLDILQHGSDVERGDCMDLLGFIALRDLTLWPQVRWYFERLRTCHGTTLGMRRGIDSWLIELTE
jgi:hypothetical protein